MKAFARYGKNNRILCLPGAIVFFWFLMFSLTGCGSSGGGGGGSYEKLTKHQIETESPSIVDVTLTATDQQNQPLVDLSRGDFILDEDGVPVNPSTADLAMYKRDSLPTGVTYSLNTVLLIDNSPSQAPYFDAIQDAAKALVDFLDDKKQQKIAVVSFNADGSPYVAQAMTDNPSVLKSKINDISIITTPGVGFDLYGGVLLGLDLWDNDASAVDGVIQQGFLVALTDGHDTAGKHTPADIAAKQAANKNDSQPKQIITVIVGPEDNVPSDFKALNNVPACMDNGYYVVSDPTTLDKNNITTLISTLASNSKNNDSIQQIMLAYADAFYWLKYKTDRIHAAGSQPLLVSLVVSIDKNSNTDIDATVSGNFSTGLFYVDKYIGLTPQYVAADSPAYVDVVFNARDIAQNAVTDLSVNDIVIKEDNAATTISEPALYDRQTFPDGHTFTLNTVLVIDNSTSQANNLQAIKDAAKSFVSGMDSGQKVAIIAYNADPSDGIADGTPQVMQLLTDSTNTLNSVIDGIQKTSVVTDFYGSLLLAFDFYADGFSPVGPDFTRTFIIALTDGNNTLSANNKSEVEAKITDLENSNIEEKQKPQINILSIGEDGPSYETVAKDIAFSNLTTAYDTEGENGFYAIDAIYQYDHGVYTNKISQLLDELESKIKGYADGYYWFRYRTDKVRGTLNHDLVLSIDKNYNVGTDASVPGSFSTDLFYSGMYAALIPHNVGTFYPWYVDAAFNARDIKGKSLTELTQYDIAALQDNVALNHVSSELTLYTRHTLPVEYSFAIRTILVVDNSPSQAGNFEDIKSAAKKLISEMDPDQEISIIAYDQNGTPNLVSPFTSKDPFSSDETVLNDAIDAITATSVATDFYGALLRALNISVDDPSPLDYNLNQTFIIALTDGNDTLSANTKNSVKTKIADIKNTTPEIQLPQVIILAIGDQAVSYVNIPDDPDNPIVYSNLVTSYDTSYGMSTEKGFYAIDKTSKYNYGVKTNQISKLMDLLESKIIDYANGFYWLRYKTGLNNGDIGADPHNLAVSIVGNDNSSADASFNGVNGNFTVADLFNGHSGVVLATGDYGGIANDGSGPVLTIRVNPGNDNYPPFMLTAATNPPAGNPYPYIPEYTWSMTGDSIIQHQDTSGNDVPGEYDVQKLGDSTITVKDTANQDAVPSTITVKVLVDSAPAYQLTAYNVESEYPGYVNAMLQARYNYYEDTEGLFAFMSKLTRDYFEVYEDIDGNDVYAADPVDNEAKDLQAWKHDTIPDGYTYKFKTVILIDNSQSQADLLSYSKEAATAMIDRALADQGPDRILGPDDSIQQEIAIITFDEDGYYTLAAPFTSDPVELVNAVNNITVGAGGTDLFDAILYGMSLWDDDYSIAGDKSLTQGVLIAITDGYDSISTSSLTDVTTVRGSGNLEKKIIAVGVSNGLTTDVYSEVLKDLNNLGQNDFYNHGDFYNVPDPGNSGETGLTSTMLSIQTELADYAGSFYWLRYLTDAAKDANSHAIKIAVRNNYDPDDVIIDGTNGPNDAIENFETSNLLVEGDVYLYKEVQKPVNGIVVKGELTHKFIYYTFMTDFNVADNYTLNAATYKDSGSQTYTWFSDNTDRVRVEVDAGDSSKAVLVPKTADGPGVVNISVTNTTPGNTLTFKVTVDAIPLPQPLLYYPFDGNADDRSGNGRDGEVFGATLTADRHNNINSAYSFNGSGDYLALHAYYGPSDDASGDYLADSVGEMTVCAWIKTDTTNASLKDVRIISFDVFKYWDLTLDLGKVGWRTTDSSGVSDNMETTDRYNDGNWHFIFATIDQNGAKELYIDGNLAEVTHINNSFIVSPVNRYGFIGAKSLAATFDGSKTQFYYGGVIDDIMVFDEVLPADTIALLMQQ